MSNIVLASSSPRRHDILSRFIENFIVMPANIDETIDENLSPIDEVVRLSLEKAKHIAGKVSHSDIVIAADTIVLYNNKIFDKPKDKCQALASLKALRGNTHQVVTAVTVIDCSKVTSFYEVTDVTFANFSDDVVDWYTSTDEPYDKAGGYAIQGKGSILVEKINGNFDNVVGLPIIKLLDVLKFSF